MPMCPEVFDKVFASAVDFASFFQMVELAALQNALSGHASNDG